MVAGRIVWVSTEHETRGLKDVLGLWAGTGHDTASIAARLVEASTIAIAVPEDRRHEIETPAAPRLKPRTRYAHLERLPPTGAPCCQMRAARNPPDAGGRSATTTIPPSAGSRRTLTVR